MPISLLNGSFSILYLPTTPSDDAPQSSSHALLTCSIVPPVSYISISTGDCSIRSLNFSSLSCSASHAALRSAISCWSSSFAFVSSVVRISTSSSRCPRYRASSSSSAFRSLMSRIIASKRSSPPITTRFKFTSVQNSLPDTSFASHSKSWGPFDAFLTHCIASSCA